MDMTWRARGLLESVHGADSERDQTLTAVIATESLAFTCRRAVPQQHVTVPLLPCCNFGSLRDLRDLRTHSAVFSPRVLLFPSHHLSLYLSLSPSLGLPVALFVVSGCDVSFFCLFFRSSGNPGGAL